MTKSKEMYYKDYLQLSVVLNAQNPLTTAHDEAFFIIAHQTHELWFKQVILELRYAIDGLLNNQISVATIASKIDRIAGIFCLLVQQLKLLENMQSIDFLDFRDALSPASGFQSLQFRVIEHLLGTLSSKSCPMANFRLQPEDLQYLENAIQEPTLMDGLLYALQKLPLSYQNAQEFWDMYRQLMIQQLQREKHILENNPYLSPGLLEKEKNQLNQIIEHLDLLYQAENSGISHARLSSLFIFLYEDVPWMCAYFRLMKALIELEEGLALWRYHHWMMVKRMIGQQPGTGGSSGLGYLQNHLNLQCSFSELTQWGSFMLPRNQLPSIPEKLRTLLIQQNVF
jgi:tryptophan 2,3-dioxygenase